jgi:hypothetical protein
VAGQPEDPGDQDVNDPDWRDAVEFAGADA